MIYTGPERRSWWPRHWERVVWAVVAAFVFGMGLGVDLLLIDLWRGYAR